MCGCGTMPRARPRMPRSRCRFPTLAGGLWLPGDADPVWPGDIDRMFISLVPPGYDRRADEPLPARVDGWVELTAIACDGAPRRCWRSATWWCRRTASRSRPAMTIGYNQTPARLLRRSAQLGYRGRDHPLCRDEPLSSGSCAAGGGICSPVRRRYALHARRAHGIATSSPLRGAGFAPIVSLSYELLDRALPGRLAAARARRRRRR